MHPLNLTSFDTYTGQQKTAALLSQATQKYLFAEDNSVGNELHISKPLSFQVLVLPFYKRYSPIGISTYSNSHTRKHRNGRDGTEAAYLAIWLKVVNCNKEGHIFLSATMDFNRIRVVTEENLCHLQQMMAKCHFS